MLRDTMKVLPIFLLFFVTVSCSVFNGEQPEDDEPCLFSDHCEPIPFFAIDTEPAWAPDGRTIAYIGSNKKGETGIYLIDSDGTNKRLFHEGAAGSPTWSPNSTWIAFHENAQIFKKNITTDSLVQLTFEGRNFFPDWSTDGEWIAYDNTTCGSYTEPKPSNSCGVLTLNLSDGSKKLIKQYSRMPTWKEDGDKLSFVNRVVLPDGEVIGDSLWTYSLADSNTRFLAFLEGDNRYPKYSPNGTSLIFTSQPYASQMNIYIMYLNNNNITQLTHEGGYSNAWSPDGEWIVYTETSETGRLWLMKPDGSNKKQLTYGV